MDFSNSNYNSKINSINNLHSINNIIHNKINKVITPPPSSITTTSLLSIPSLPFEFTYITEFSPLLLIHSFNSNYVIDNKNNITTTAVSSTPVAPSFICIEDDIPSEVEYQLLSTDIESFHSNCSYCSSDEEDEEGNDCICTHPFVKDLRNYQNEVFGSSNIINNNNDTSSIFTNDKTIPSCSLNSSTTTSSNSITPNTVAEPFKDIVSIIEEQVDYYKKQNETMHDINNIYFQYFCNNINYTIENQKKIKQLESLLNDFKGVGCQLKSVSNQSNYLNNKLN